MAPRTSRFARAEANWYVEEEWAVRYLFKAERFEGDIYDPACGLGTILRIARERGHVAVGSDLHQRWGAEERDCWVEDFLAPPPAAARDNLSACSMDWDNVVCNPPFPAAEQFVHRALGIANRKVAVLARLAWLEGAERHRTLFKPFPPRRVWVFRERVCCLPGEQVVAGEKPGGGQVAFAWYVWERGSRCAPEIGWL